jgi:endonuclease III
MTKAERYLNILDYFRTNNPTAETELYYENPYQLLVAVILSAQCTDKRVNLTTPALFNKYPTSKKLAKAEFEDVFALIRSISYPNNKAKHLIGMAQKLEADFNGEVPSNIIDLQTLPGVGRKTANVIVSVVFSQPAMAVDTHVFRVSARIGLTTNAKNPLQTEQQLVKNIPSAEIHIAHHWLILHGRYTCLARSPKCDECAIKNYCKYYESNQKQKRQNPDKPKKPGLAFL